MQNKNSKIIAGALCIYFIISCFTPNVMSQIGKRKIYGINDVREIEGCHETWEWMGGLETFGALSVEYKRKYLREEVLDVTLSFYLNSNDVRVGILVSLSELDKVRMKLEAFYDYEEKRLIYEPVYILQGEPGNSLTYSDEKSIDEYLAKYGLTRQDVKEYLEYAIYDVIVKTWTKAHLTELYWLERWKLKLCKVTDHTFWFEEE